MKQLSARQKEFARLVHSGEPAYKAYERAGYRYDLSNPYKLTENYRIKAYIRDLERETMKRHEVTIDRLLTDLETAKENARKAGQPASEVTATMAQAKLCGLITDKAEVSTKDINKMTMEEVVDALREVMGDKADAILRAAGVNIPESKTHAAKSQFGPVANGHNKRLV
jgi:hypothetical protein